MDEKKKAGRPVKPTEERSTSRVWVYLTKSERKDLDRYCDEHLLSVSSLFRKLLKKEGIVTEKESHSGAAHLSEDA
jgi:hypothetical protein